MSVPASEAEAKLHKLKVTELKDLLAKHALPQTGRKDDLVHRLISAGVFGDATPEEELVELPEDDDHAAPEAKAPSSAPAPTSAPAPATQTASAPEPVVPSVPVAAPEPTPAPAVVDSGATDKASTETSKTDESTEAVVEEVELTEEQKKQKARAERFGIPFKPTIAKPAAKPATAKPKPSPPKADTLAPAPAPAKANENARQKPVAIDRTPLGISPEVLARRAAKFGLPAKDVKKDAAPAVAPVQAAVAPAKKELTAEEAANLAAEEEKKRKRAEKFGSVKPSASANGEDGPDAKKAKVE